MNRRKMENKVKIEKAMEVRKDMQARGKEIRGSRFMDAAAQHLMPSVRLLAPIILLMAMLSLSVFGATDAYAGTHQITAAVADTTSPVKTGVEQLMITLSSAANKGGNDVTAAIVTLYNAAAADVASVKMYYGAALDGSVNNPTYVENLKVNSFGAAALGASPWKFYVKFKDSANAKTGVNFIVVSMSGSDNGYLPSPGANHTMVLGCGAKAPNDVSLKGKTSTSIQIQWTNQSGNTTYKIYRQREDQGSMSWLTNTTVNPYNDSTPVLLQLTKYAYIVNGYENLNACESTESNTLISMTLQANRFNITTCGGCHTTPPDDSSGNPRYRGIPDGAVLGRHANPYHTGGVQAGDEACPKCHSVNTLPAHRDGYIEMNTVNIFGYAGSYYDKNQSYTNTSASDSHFIQDNAPINSTNITDNGFCMKTYCHGSRGASAVWGYSSGNSQCTLCHGMGDGMLAKDTESQTSQTDEQVGAHNNHLHVGTLGTNFINMSTPNACEECHTVPARHDSVGHYDTADPAEIIFGTLAKSGFANGDQYPAMNKPFYNTTTNYWTCTNTYCHDGKNYKNAWANAANITVPTWNTTTYLNEGTPSTANCKNKCHAYPPLLGGHSSSTDCSFCHDSVASNDYTFNSRYYNHLDGIVQASGNNCLDCHNVPRSNTDVYDADNNGVRNATLEFGKNSHHIANGTTVTTKHCAVCHGEGNNLGDFTTRHADGKVDLRNTDSLDVYYIFNGQTSQWGGVDAHCLSCHDANGATATGTWITGAAATDPFKDSRKNNYDQIVRTAGTINVANQTNPTNASHHAVRGTRYTATTLYNYGLLKSTNVEGVVIKDNSRLHCGDCHTVGLYKTSGGVGAHGSQAEYMLRIWDTTGNQNGTDVNGYTSKGTTATNHIICFKCHPAASYATHSGYGTSCDSETIGLIGLTNRVTGDGGEGSILGYQCALCHNNGPDVFGGIHGGTGTYVTATPSTVTHYRFMPGMGNTKYEPRTWSASAAGSAGACYTTPLSSYNSCAKHTTAPGKDVTRTTTRNTSY